MKEFEKFLAYFFYNVLLTLLMIWTLMSLISNVNSTNLIYWFVTLFFYSLGHFVWIFEELHGYVHTLFLSWLMMPIGMMIAWICIVCLPLFLIGDDTHE